MPLIEVDSIDFLPDGNLRNLCNLRDLSQVNLREICKICGKSAYLRNLRETFCKTGMGRRRGEIFSDIPESCYDINSPTLVSGKFDTEF